jgi:O-antigen/teichoic acid export membrane protein
MNASAFSDRNHAMETPANHEVAEGHGVARNAVFLLLAKVISTAIGVFLVLFLARKLGTEQFGIYTLGHYYAGLYIILGDLGLNNLLTRELARSRSSANALIGKVFLLKGLLNIATVALSVLVLFLLDYGENAQQVVLVILVGQFCVGSFLMSYYHIFEGFERMQYVTIIEAVKKILDVVCCVTVLSYGFSLLVMVSVMIFTDLLTLLLAWRVARSCLSVRIHPVMRVDEWRALIVSALPYGLILVFFELINSLDTTMLAKFRTQEEVGWYGAALRITSVLSLVPLMCASAMFPTAARLFQSSLETARSIFAGVLRLMILIGLPIAVGTTIEADGIIEVLFTRTYAPAAEPLRLLIWSITLYFLNMPMVLFLSAIEKQRYGTAVVGFSALCNGLLNFFMIPALGMAGAAASTIISQCIILVLCMKKIHGLMGRLDLMRYLFQSMLGCLVMAIAVWPLRMFNPFPVIAIGGLSYFIALMLIGAVDRNDWAYLRRLFQPPQ